MLLVPYPALFSLLLIPHILLAEVAFARYALKRQVSQIIGFVFML